MLVFCVCAACGGDKVAPQDEVATTTAPSQPGPAEADAPNQEHAAMAAATNAEPERHDAPEHGAMGDSPASAGRAGDTMNGTNTAGPTTAPGQGSAGSNATDDGSAAVAGTSAMASAAGAQAAMGSSTAAAACDRACLTGFNDAYLAALTAHDASQLDTAPDVRFTENGQELPLNEGLWAVARELGPYRQDMAEVPAGQTAGFVSLTDDRGDVLLAFRLKVVERNVTEIETTVCRNGEATFFSPGSLMHNPLYDQELDTADRLPRDELVRIVDLYFDGIETSDGSAIPFADSARRNENGQVTGMGSALKNVAMFSYIDRIDRRYVLVDEERGNVLPWVLFQIPNGFTGSRTLHLAELFKVDGGQIMDVQAIMVNQPLGTPSGWGPDDAP